MAYNNNHKPGIKFILSVVMQCQSSQQIRIPPVHHAAPTKGSQQIRIPSVRNAAPNNSDYRGHCWFAFNKYDSLVSVTSIDGRDCTSSLFSSDFNKLSELVGST